LTNLVLPVSFVSALGRKCWDYGWLISLVIYQIVFLCIPAIKVIESHLPPASSMTLLMEQVGKMFPLFSLFMNVRKFISKLHDKIDDTTYFV
jgi:hypothetical protein